MTYETLVVVVTNEAFLEQGEQREFLYEQKSKLDNANVPNIIFTNKREGSNFELGGLKYAYDNFPNVDEIFLLQDTTEILNTDVFKIIFDDLKGEFVYCNPIGQMYMNKYLRWVLDRLEIPLPKSKLESVKYESEFNNMCAIHKRPYILFPKFSADYSRKVIKFGRENILVENEYFRKYNGCWCASMVNKNLRSGESYE